MKFDFAAKAIDSKVPSDACVFIAVLARMWLAGPRARLAQVLKNACATDGRAHRNTADARVVSELRGFKHRASNLLESLTADDDSLSQFVSIAGQELDDLQQVRGIIWLLLASASSGCKLCHLLCARSCHPAQQHLWSAPRR